eukprot:TRINITY_DN5832_c0_g1_i1.p2 TRINITY_DN5832_c0_g1~~TRINITY_DN5832_c0_g1_i1.p2  ORF type:complete len:213 (+),score=33.93 TRINITY_DN5832_c0_g1_i1:291-929(+)
MPRRFEDRRPSDIHLRWWTPNDQKGWRKQRIAKFEEDVRQEEVVLDDCSRQRNQRILREYGKMLKDQLDVRMKRGKIKWGCLAEIALPNSFFLALWTQLASQSKAGYDYRHYGSWAKNTFYLVIRAETTISALQAIFGDEPFEDRIWNAEDGTHNNNLEQGPLAGGVLRVGPYVRLLYNYEQQKLKIRYAYQTHRWAYNPDTKCVELEFNPC